MSLELAIQQNTAAIERLISVLTETLPQPVTVNIGEFPPPSQDAENSGAIAADVAEEPAPAKKTRAKKEAAPVAPAPLETSAPAPEAGATDASETEAAAVPIDPPTYADAAAAVTEVIKARGTAVAKKILGRVGGKTLKDVVPEDFPAVICACELELARG